MKRIFSAILVGFMLFSVVPMTVAYASEAAYQENVMDKMSDWAATIGKDKVERDKILTTRKAERQRKHIEKKAAQMKKKADKKAQEMKRKAKEKKKKMGKKLGR